MERNCEECLRAYRWVHEGVRGVVKFLVSLGTALVLYIPVEYVWENAEVETATQDKLLVAMLVLAMLGGVWIGRTIVETIGKGRRRKRLTLSANHEHLPQGVFVRELSY